MKKTLTALGLALLILLSSCSKNTETDITEPAPSTDTTPTTAGEAETAEVTMAADADDNKVEISGDFTITPEDANGEVSLNGNVYNITKAGVYILRGKLENGRIEVNVEGDGEVELDLEGCSISVGDNSPIFFVNCEDATVKSVEGSYNEIIDNRKARSDTSTDDDTQGNGAISAKCDLKISGKGSLSVTASYNNGIHTSKDLKVKNTTLKVTAYNNALKGKDSVEIESGNLILISSGGDGIKTDDSDVSDKGNQRGTVSITGGTVNIYSACDGIDAAYNADISGDASVSIMTDKYSDYSGSVAVSGGKEFYIIVPKASYSTSYRYAAYYYNDDTAAGVWAEASYYTMVSSGRTQYYGLKLTAPSGYSNICFFRFKGSQSNSTETYDACSDNGSVNTSMNAWLISSVGSSKIDGDWVSMTTSSSSSGKSGTSYSCKGIKAANAINISGGTLVIQATDDAIHANNETALESGAAAEGTVNITGGNLTLTSGDDGIHADSTVNMDGGTTNIVTSYEGIEGVFINFKSGTTYIYATDDGVNACTGNDRSKTPLISISGGYLDVTTKSGDTDGMDSNGSIAISGGFTIVKGGASQGSVAGSVDVDGSITVTGGTIVALGGICELPSNSKICTVTMNGKSFAAGDYVLSGNNEELITFSLKTGYSNGWICSDKLTTGSSYTLTKSGSSFTSWTQSSTTTQNGTTVTGGMGGGGGFGGGGSGGKTPGRR